jgi:integrase/recombinase XerD
MKDPLRVRVSGPLERYVSGFRVWLSGLGYTPNSASDLLWLMAHASGWVASQRLQAADLTPRRVEEFLAVRRATGYVQWRSAKAMVPLLEYLRELGVVPVPVSQPLTPVETVLARYRDYLLDERCLAATTARGYVDMVRPFINARSATAGGEPDLAGLSAGDVSRFVLAACADCNRGSAKLLVTALRSLLRLLHITAVTTHSLVTAVPSVASWRLAGLCREG